MKFFLLKQICLLYWSLAIIAVLVCGCLSIFQERIIEGRLHLFDDDRFQMSDFVCGINHEAMNSKSPALKSKSPLGGQLINQRIICFSPLRALEDKNVASSDFRNFHTCSNVRNLNFWEIPQLAELAKTFLNNRLCIQNSKWNKIFNFSCLNTASDFFNPWVERAPITFTFSSHLDLGLNALSRNSYMG
jgi:hypothetical protein